MTPSRTGRQPPVEVPQERGPVRDRGEAPRGAVRVLRAALERPQVFDQLRVEERLDVREVAPAEFEPSIALLGNSPVAENGP